MAFSRSPGLVGDAFRINFSKPCLSSVGSSEHLEMTLVADLPAGIDVKPDRHENASFARFIAGEFGFLILIQSREVPAR